MTDAEVLNTVYDLAQDVQAKDAAHHSQQTAAKEPKKEWEKVKLRSDRDKLLVKQAVQNVVTANRKLNQAKAAQRTGTNEAVQKADKDLETAKLALEKAKTNLEKTDRELGIAADTLGALVQSIATAREEASTAREALKKAIDSHQFDFNAMSVTDLANLSMVLDDHPDVTRDAEYQITASAKRIKDAVRERFTNPSEETGTIDAIAQASRDGSASRALANAISSMKPAPWAKLFMLVQGQANRLDEPGDPFIEKLMGKIADIDPATMQFLDERIERNFMTPLWRDRYVSRLDTEIFKSVVATGANRPDTEAFLRCSERLTAHVEACSARQSAKPEGERTPYLANLTTAELAKMFEVLQKEPRWSASDSGRTLVAQFSSRFHACLMATDLMATDGKTARENLDAIAGAAMSTSYVASLTPLQIGRLFEVLQKNAGAWRSESTKPFTAQVNSRFVHHYLRSVDDQTSPDELAWLSNVLGDLGKQANTPFGTLGTDEVAQLFVASQRVIPHLPNADVIADDLGRKLAACYAKVDLKTHQMLIRSYPSMSPAGQRLFTEVANRPPAELQDLLVKVFQGMTTKLNPEISGQSHDFLKAFQDVMEYRMSLPGSEKTPGAMREWLRDALPVSGATVNVAMFATSAGPFRDAWLGASKPGNLHQYVNSAALAAQSLDPQQWNKFDAVGSVTRFFADENTSWTPDLQKHFNGLFKFSSGEPQKDICRFHLEVLRTHQTMMDAKGITEREAKKMIETLKKMGSGAFLDDSIVQLRLTTKDSAGERRENMLKNWSSAVTDAQKALLIEGANLYMKSIPPLTA